MASVNKVILVGNLGRDPEVRSTPDGFNVANVSIATTFSWRDKNTGERRDETEWHRVVFYNRQAEVVGQYLKKGSQIYVEGRLRTRKYTGQDGIERYTTEIVADTMQMLGGRNGGDAPMAEPMTRAGASTQGGGQYSTPSSGARDSFGDEFASSSPAPQAGRQATAHASRQSAAPMQQTRTAPPQAERPAAPQTSEPFNDMDDDVPF